jgi:predicted small lipoprotein YifL
MKKIYMSLIIAVTLISLSACTVGARGHLNFSEAKYPISLSPALYDQNDNVLVKGKQLNVVGKFKYEKRFWGLSYSWIRISGSKDVDQAINEAIQKEKGVGLINLAVTTDGCLSNSMMTFPFSILPVIPGCTDTIIEGDIVNLR